MNASMGTIETPYGPALVAWTSRGVVALDAFVTGEPLSPPAIVRFRELVAVIADEAPGDGEVPRRWLARLDAAFAGDARRSPLDLSLFEPLRRDIYQAVTTIPRGTVVSYADIARDVGRPRAWRAVGTALRRCPIDLLIPCHRVVHAGGTIGGPTAASIEWKRTLLEGEGVRL